MGLLTKAQAFERLRLDHPRGGDVGTKVYYADASTGQRVEFRVVAEQTWVDGLTARVMGLVWGGTCRACGDGFFQLSPTHPQALAETCPFCASAPLDTFNARDTKVFNPKRYTGPSQSIGIKRRGRIENHILELVAHQYSDYDTIRVEELVQAAVDAMPVPEEGARDTRKQSVVRALHTLSREKDGPLQVKGGLVIFYE